MADPSSSQVPLGIPLPFPLKTMRHWRPEELWKARGAHSAPPCEIKVFKLHPGTPTVNHEILKLQRWK